MKRGKKSKDIKEYALKRVKEIVELTEKMNREGGYYWTEPYFYSELQDLVNEFDEAFLITEEVEGEEVNALYFLFEEKYYRLCFRSLKEPMFAEEISEKEYEKRKIKLYSQSSRKKRYF